MVGGNHGVLQGSATYDVGLVGSAFRVSSIPFGSTNVVSVPHSPTIDFDTSSPLTLETWVYPFAATWTGAHIMGKREGGGCVGQTDFYQIAVGSGSIPLSSVPGDTWTHLAITWDGTTLRHFVNGIRDADGTFVPASNTAPLTFGNAGGCNGFAGLIDEVALYNRALEPAELAAIADAGATGKCMPTQLYAHDFESAVGSEWSTSLRSTTITGRTFLGEFGNDVATLTLPVPPDASTVRVDFDLYVIRSWDGSDAASHGPDIWDLSVQDGPTLVHTTFSNCEPLLQSFPATYPDGAYPPTTGAIETNTLGYNQLCVPYAATDAVYRISVAFPWTEPVVSLDFSGSGLQALTDESWGLDNIRVSAW